MILANSDLVLPDRVMHGAIHIEGEQIAGITEGDVVPPGAVDCGGDLLNPGLIKLRTDELERHILPRPGVEGLCADLVCVEPSYRGPAIRAVLSRGFRSAE